jgi:heme oxygenase
MGDVATVCALARSCARQPPETAQRARTHLAGFQQMAVVSFASRMSLSGQLRDITAPVRDGEPLAGRVTAADYRVYLLRLYGFHVTLERALTASRGLASVVADAALRNHKAALLAHDLVALGLDRRALLQAPRLALAAALALPEALGWTYVVEHGVLGGKPLARRLARQLPVEIQTASAYLRCYGEEAPERWRELGEAIDGFEHAERDGDRVIAAAIDGFQQLRAWLQPAAPARSARLHA